MLSESVRQRLEQLNRTSHLAAVERNVPQTDASCRQQSEAVAAPAPATSYGDTLSLPGTEIETKWGPHWRIQRAVDAVWPGSRRYVVKSRTSTAQANGSEARVDFEDDLSALQHCVPHRAVYLDLETCGFAGSMVFLIGLLHWQAEQLTLTQLWARNYAEEKAILQSLWSIMDGNALLITFNGKSFDWPQVHDRSTLHHLGYRKKDGSEKDPPNSLGLSLPRRSLPRGSLGLTPLDARPEPWHFDVLHHARRRWKSQLPNCRLQTLEHYICGRRRVDDLAGSKIPPAYHDYVRTGNLTEVNAILHHNALDLVTLLQLALLFLNE